MKNSLGKLLVSTSMAIGLGAVAATSAQAGTLTGATIGGTDASDYDVYTVQGSNTKRVTVPNKADFLQEALTGDATSPTGNVELRASTEKSTFTAAEFAENTTLVGQIGGKSLTLSSLTLSDWTNTYKDEGKSFGQYWFESALASKNVSLGSNPISDAQAKASLFAIFQTYGGFQRFSDPNISYVNQDDVSGKISIGLAGHFNATSLISKSIDAYLSGNNLSSTQIIFANGLKSKLPTSIQASEVVKYTYNGVTDYKYSFSATKSNLTDIADGQSHNGNYEVTIDGVPPTKVPEPSVILGVLGVAGIVAAQRKLKKVSA